MAWLAIGLKILPYIFSAVRAIEDTVRAVKGKPKEDAAVGAVHAILQAVEAGAERDLLNNEDVNRATRKVMQAIVHLQNTVAAVREAAKPVGPGVS